MYAFETLFTNNVNVNMNPDNWGGGWGGGGVLSDVPQSEVRPCTF